MFTSTRLKLTGWYLLIIMAVTFAFSLLVYRMLALEVERFDLAQRVRMQRDFFALPPNPQLVDDAKKHILVTLLTIDAGVFVVSGALGYFLAGRTLQPIQVMVEEQNRFISDASHELKTPLTSLKSAFEVYLRSTKKSVRDADEIIKDSISEVDKLKYLSESLLQLAQYETANTRAKITKVSLEKVTSVAIQKVQGLALEKKIEIINSVGSEKVLANEFGIEELMVILLDNAIKYSPEKSSVELKSKKQDSRVTIQVTDHGIGIKPKDLPHIFDRFYRADAARSHNAGQGYGLGLSIAKKIVESQGGAINVKSSPNKGTTFTVIFLSA